MCAVSFDHIACGLSKIRNAFGILSSIGVVRRKGGNAGHFRGGQWKFRNGSVLELLEPLEGAQEDNFLQRFLHKNGPGLHHITFLVPNIHEAVSRAKQLQFAVVGENYQKPHWQEVFIHPKQALGIVVQMVQYTPTLAGGWNSDWQGFEQCESTPPIKKIESFQGFAGLAFSLQTNEELERSHRLFSTLLCASKEETRGNTTLYQWLNSPMYISVTTAKNLDTSKNKKQAARPIGIEVLSKPEQINDLQTHVKEILGTTFIATVDS